MFHLWLIFIHIFSMFVSVCRPQPVFLCKQRKLQDVSSALRGSWVTRADISSLISPFLFQQCFLSSLHHKRNPRLWWSWGWSREEDALTGFFSKRTHFLLQPPSRHMKPCFHVQDEQQRPQHHTYYSVVFTACHRIFRPISFGGLSTETQDVVGGEGWSRQEEVLWRRRPYKVKETLAEMWPKRSYSTSKPPSLQQKAQTFQIQPPRTRGVHWPAASWSASDALMKNSRSSSVNTCLCSTLVIRLKVSERRAVVNTVNLGSVVWICWEPSATLLQTLGNEKNE